MSVDLRRFSYPLDPLRRQRRWKLDACLARLGKVQRQLNDSQTALDTLRQQCAHETRQVASLLATRIDPAYHSHSLRWLAGLQERIHLAEARLEELRAERTTLQMECLRHQRKLDALDAHREDCVTEFAREEAGRMATESDRDWLARASLKRRVARRAGTRDSAGNHSPEVRS